MNMTATPQLSNDQMEAIAETLHVEARRYVAPLWWARDPTDANTVLHNASCFFVEIADKRFGVTADHVVYGNNGEGAGGYLSDRQRHDANRLMIRNTDMSDWETRVIDHDHGLDVTTFRVSDDEFKAIACRPFRCAPERWPPQPPDVGRGVFIAGCPGGERRVLGQKGVEFLIETNGLVLTNCDGDELEVTIDRADLSPMAGIPVPSLTKDLGGYSGAPLLVVSAAPLGPLFWLGGVVFRQLRALDEHSTTTLWARRPTCIGTNGHLIKSRHQVAGEAP